MFLRTLLTGTVALSVSAVSAYAQKAPLEDEIIVVGLRDVPVSDVTSSVTLIDTEDLAIRNSPFIADQLRAVPGVGVSRSGGLGNLTQIRIRGAEANHTLVLVNGIEVSDPTTGETNFGLWSGLNAQRVEIARGEQSGLYGSDAIGGVVSITTGGENGLNLTGEVGSFGTVRGQAGYNGQVEGLTYGLSLSGFSTDGIDITNIDGGDKDGSKSYSGIYTAGIEFSPDVELNALASYRVTETEFDSFNADTSDTKQWIAGLTLDAQTGLINHIARTSYTRLSRENLFDGNFVNETIGQRTKFNYSPSIDIGNDTQGLTLSGLAEIENEDYARINPDTFFGDSNQNVEFKSASLGGEARGRFNGFAANGSVRFDDNDDQFENTTTWRVGAAYNTTFGGKLRGSIGTGVKNPNFSELFGFVPANFIGNPDLMPEESQSWEIGYDQSFGDFNGSIVYFSADLENEIIFNNFFNGVINRDSDSKRSGIEVSASYQFNDAFYLAGFVSKVDSDDQNGDAEIRVPQWTASSSINWESQSKEGLRAGIALDYVGEQDDLNFSTFPAERVNIDSYFLLSATAEYPVLENLSLTLRGENLLDETTRDVASFNQTGAGVFVGFKLR